MSQPNSTPGDFFRGEKVRLRMMTPDESAENGVRWTQSTEYYRLLDDEPMVPASLEQTRKHVEAHQSKTFAIELLDPAGTIIGFTALWKCETPGGDGWLAIGIGDSEHRGAGRGVDAQGAAGARRAGDRMHRVRKRFVLCADEAHRADGVAVGDLSDPGIQPAVGLAVFGRDDCAAAVGRVWCDRGRAAAGGAPYACRRGRLKTGMNRS